MSLEGGFAATVGLLVAFAAMAGAAHDFWAATVVYCVALLTAAALLLARSWPEDGPGVRVPVPAALAGAAAALTASFLASAHPSESWFRLMDWLAAGWVFLCAIQLYRDEDALDATLAVGAAVAVVECAIILRQHWDYALLPDAPSGAWRMTRYLASLQVPGTLVNSSVATAFLLLWTPVLFARARRGGPRLALWRSGAAAAVLGVLALDSNWGMVCLAAGAPFLDGPRAFVERVRRRPRAAAAAAVAGFAAFAALLAWKFTHTRNMNDQPLPPGETTRRFLWWAAGMRMFRDHPWLGVGLGNFPSAYPAYRAPGVQNTLFPHNIAVGLLAETGAAGTAALAAFLGATLAAARARLEERWPYLLGLLMFAAFGQMGLSVEYLANLLCAALFLGILAAPAEARPWKPRRSVSLVLAALAVSALPALIAPLSASIACEDGRRRLAAGDAEGAARRYADASAMDARSAEAHSGRALALAALHSSRRDPALLAEALREQEAAVRLDPLNPVLRAEFESLRREDLSPITR